MCAGRKEEGRTDKEEGRREGRWDGSKEERKEGGENEEVVL